MPHLFSLAEKAEQKQFGDVLLDFRYLKTPELCEHRIESSPELIARDAEVWEAHESIISRLFALFEAVYTYIKDFAKCVGDLREGLYIQQTVEGVLEHGAPRPPARHPASSVDAGPSSAAAPLLCSLRAPSTFSGRAAAGPAAAPPTP